MVVKVQGNHGPNSRGGNGGLGIQNVPNGTIGWVSVIGKEGDVGYLTSASINSNNVLQLGYSFQSPAGCTVDFTLANAGMVMSNDPAVLDAIPWGNTLTVTAGADIVFATFPFSGIRVTFTGDGELYIVSH